MVIEPNKPTKALRTIAVFEGVKGTAGVAFAVGLFGLAQHRVYPWVQWMVERFHFADAAVAPRRVIEVLAHPEEFPLAIWMTIAVAYSVLRFAEAYGLWLARRWGEWLTLIGAALYLPFEIYWIVLGATLAKIALLAANVALVIYLAVVLVKTRRKRARAARDLAAGRAIGTPAGGH